MLTVVHLKHLLVGCEGVDVWKPISGFTVVEMVLTILIMSVMALVTLPFFINHDHTDPIQLLEEIEKTLLFAQKAALTKRRIVCVDTGLNTLTLAISDTPHSLCHMPLIHPSEAHPFLKTIPKNFTLNSIRFNFSTLGQPIDDAGHRLSSPQHITMTHTVNNEEARLVGQVIVEAETGYVHTVIQQTL